MRTRRKVTTSNERVFIEGAHVCQLVSHSIRACLWDDLATLKIGHVFSCEDTLPEDAPATDHQRGWYRKAARLGQLAMRARDAAFVTITARIWADVSILTSHFAETARRHTRDWTVEHWIRLHWFELSALVLLGLNLWFVIKVLSVLRAVQDGLILLARWLDIARGEVDRQPGAGTDSGKD